LGVRKTIWNHHLVPKTQRCEKEMINPWNGPEDDDEEEWEEDDEEDW
jgi:hypothetical protein